MRTVDALNRIAGVLEAGDVPRAQEEWGGADVLILHAGSEPIQNSWRPVRCVITAHALELSWLFFQLMEAFYAEDRIDSCTKIEFFGRLANAANRCLTKEPDASAILLCAGVLHEAYAMLEEMDAGEFEFFVVGIGGDIADDYIDDALRSGFVGCEATQQYFSERGVVMPSE